MDGISKALNSDFEMEESLPVIIPKKEITLTEDSSNSRLKIDDKEYMRLELMETITSLQNLRMILEQDLSKPPRKASDIEAYTLVVSQIKECVRELRQLDAESSNLELNQRRLDKQISLANGGNATIGTQVNNTFILDNKQLREMINNARENNSLKTIDAEFKKDDQIR
jgi:hypothetical protein